jgi:hypothetical protein
MTEWKLVIVLIVVFDRHTKKHIYNTQQDTFLEDYSIYVCNAV